MLEELEERKRLIQEELSQTGMRPNVLRISENNKGNLKKKIAVNSMKSTLNWIVFTYSQHIWMYKKNR